MNTMNVTPLNSVEVLKTLLKASPGFASFTYRSKSDGSTARYTLNLGFKYLNLLKKSEMELRAKIELNEFSGDELLAANEVLASLQKSIEAQEKGEQNEDYTRKGLMVPLSNGVNLNHDNSIQVFGLVESKTVLIPGEPKKPVKSKPMTILKNKIKKELPISKFREFAFDKDQIQSFKVNGKTIEIL
jgi:hypothetical protein